MKLSIRGPKYNKNDLKPQKSNTQKGGLHKNVCWIKLIN